MPLEHTPHIRPTHPATPGSPTGLVDLRQAAILAETTPAAILAAARAGQLWFIRVGRSYRFRPADLRSVVVPMHDRPRPEPLA